jgi:hypothetical protein
MSSTGFATKLIFGGDSRFTPQIFSEEGLLNELMLCGKSAIYETFCQHPVLFSGCPIIKLRNQLDVWFMCRYPKQGIGRKYLYGYK